MKDELRLPKGMVNGKIVSDKRTSHAMVQEWDEQLVRFRNRKLPSLAGTVLPKPKIHKSGHSLGWDSTVPATSRPLIVAWVPVGSTIGKRLLMMLGETRVRTQGSCQIPAQGLAWYHLPQSTTTFLRKTVKHHTCHLTFSLTHKFPGFLNGSCQDLHHTSGWKLSHPESSMSISVNSSIEK